MTSYTLVDRIATYQDYKLYGDLHWNGSFEDYLELVRRNPRVARTAYERLYDMVLSYGTEEYVDSKKKITRYSFFRDETHGGRDAIFGLDIPLMRLMNVVKAAALRYGTEKRIILLHGPVGSSKSTIARLLKKGLEDYAWHDAASSLAKAPLPVRCSACSQPRRATCSSESPSGTAPSKRLTQLSIWSRP